MALVVKNLPANDDTQETMAGSITGSGRSSGVGNANTL